MVHAWRSICKDVKWFNSHLGWKMKNCIMLSFWHSNWSSFGPLYNSLTRLYALSTQENGSLRDMWNFEQCGWDLHNRRPLREREASQWSNISANLPPAPIPKNNQLDCFIWKPNRNSSFIVQSAQFVSLASTFSSPTLDGPFSYHSWTYGNQRFLKNTKFSYGLLSHKGIFTNESIQHMLKNLCLNPNCCILYKNSSETTYHIFLHCSIVKSFWNKAKDLTESANNVDNLIALCNHICTIHVKFQKGLILFKLLMDITWTTWLDRNNKLFNNS